MKISRSFEKNVSVGQFLFEKHSASYEEVFDSERDNIVEVSDYLYRMAKTDVLNSIAERQKDLAETTMKKEFKATEEKAKAGRGKMTLQEQNPKNYKKTTFREGEEGYKKIDTKK